MNICYIPNMNMNYNHNMDISTWDSMNMDKNCGPMMQYNIYQNNQLQNNSNYFDGMNFKNNNC